MKLHPVLVIILIIILVLLVLVVVRKRSDDRNFDERQLQLRGNAYKYAFFALLLFEAFYAIALLFVGRPLMADGVSALLGIFLSITVFAVYCIKNDAFKTNTHAVTFKSYCILLVIVIILNSWNGIQSLRSGELLDSGLLQMSVAAPACAVCFLIVLIALLVKAASDKEEEEI